MLLSIAIYLFLMLSYVQVKVNNDRLVYFGFVRRLVGRMFGATRIKSALALELAVPCSAD